MSFFAFFFFIAPDFGGGGCFLPSSSSSVGKGFISEETKAFFWGDFDLFRSFFDIFASAFSFAACFNF